MANTAPIEDFDDFSDYDVDLAELDNSLFDQYKINNAAVENAKPAPVTTADDVGVDEEIIIKKRKRAVKLDETRLCSDAIGIPELERTAPKRLKFKGKGHEYQDLGKILVFYQLWADKLYPKANFRDTLSIVEKLGHSKRMRNERLAWIDKHREKAFNKAEERVKEAGVELSLDDALVGGLTNADNDDHLCSNDSVQLIINKFTDTNANTNVSGDSFFIDADEDMDDLEELIRESERTERPNTVENGLDHVDELLQKSSKRRKEEPDKVSHDEDTDELELMIREAEAVDAAKPESGPRRSNETHQEDFDDDMEAMAEFET